MKYDMQKDPTKRTLGDFVFAYSAMTIKMPSHRANPTLHANFIKSFPA